MRGTRSRINLRQAESQGILVLARAQVVRAPDGDPLCGWQLFGGASCDPVTVGVSRGTEFFFFALSLSSPTHSPSIAPDRVLKK